jgi:hypothetical protein
MVITIDDSDFFVNQHYVDFPDRTHPSGSVFGLDSSPVHWRAYL